MNLLIDTKWDFTKSKLFQNINTLQTENRRIFLSLIKDIKKNKENIVTSGERQNTFLLRWETRQKYQISPSLFNFVLEVLSWTIRQAKETQTI